MDVDVVAHYLPIGAVAVVLALAVDKVVALGC